MKPKILDLFCGAGGAAMGYHRAGFEVVGVDIEPQPNYPFEFVRDDALEFLGGMLVDASWWDFDVIHASPPCQAFTKYKNARPNLPDKYPDLIAPTRRLLRATGLPYVIENVVGSPLEDPVVLCGSMFDPPLDVQRHRLFESNVQLTSPKKDDHSVWPTEPRYPGGRSRERGGPRVLVRRTVEIGRWNIALAVQKAAMGGVDWMTLEELSESVPPVYTECIGTQLLEQLP